MRTTFLFLWLLAMATVAFPVAAASVPGASGLTLPHSVVLSVRPVGRPDDPHRPRAYRPHTSAVPLTAQAHAGFFHPVDNFSTGFEVGFRVGPQLDPHIRIGMAVDWWHRSDDKVLDLGTVEAPGGIAYQELILSESAANLVPIMAFVQVNGDESMPVIPYGGVGVGYEWLFLSANDYLTRDSFDETFGGMGWRAWVGAGLPLDWGTLVSAEVFFNGSEVGSEMDVYVPGYGPATVRDVIDMNGVGMRLGVSWGF